MNAKFKSILELALHPNTGQGEQQAALNAARKMVAGQGLEALLGQAPQETSERVVYKNFDRSYSVKVTITVPPSYMHNMVTRLFVDGPSLGVDVELLECKAPHERFDSGMTLVFKLHGTHDTVHAFDKVLDAYIEQMNKDLDKPRSNTNREKRPPPPEPKKGFWAKIFG